MASHSGLCTSCGEVDLFKTYEPVQRSDRPAACELCRLAADCRIRAGIPAGVWQWVIGYKLLRGPDESPSGASWRRERHGQIRVVFYRRSLLPKVFKKGIGGLHPEHGILDDVDTTTEGLSLVDVTYTGHLAQGCTGCTRCQIPQLINTDLIRAWLQNCETNHCHPNTDDLAWQRLHTALDLGMFRAVDTESGRVVPLTMGAEYVALSYVWGREALPSRQQASSLLPVSGYPPTIRDALTLSRQMGYRYLWVDRICINQNSPAEKAALIPQMRDIFGLAQLTIVAAASSGAHTGLTGVGSTARAEESVYRIRNITLLHAARSFNTMYEACTWRTRGWTLQEHVFSRRLLYVFSSEVVLSCSSGTYRESTGKTYTPGSAGSTWADFGASPPSVSGLLHAKLNGEASLSHMDTRDFIRSVEEYTARDLTFEGDRLNAFAGVITAADMLEDLPANGSALKHGLPLHFFEAALTWQPEEGINQREPVHERGFAPSWSWASAGTRVHFLDSGESHSTNCWFRYSKLNGFDVLGTPALPVAEAFVSMAADARTSTTTLNRIMAEQPWNTTLASAYEANDQAVLPHGLGKLPVLHLLTVIFEATIKPTEQDRVWSLGASITVLDSSSRRESSNTNEHISQFAIVGGREKAFVMWLEADSNLGLFRRRGLFRSSLLGRGGLGSLARKGNARWQLVQIV